MTKKELMRLLISSFRKGMNEGYGIDHEHVHEEESKAVERFKEDMLQYLKEQNK